MATFNRRQAREWALQLLFQIDANPVRDLTPVIRDFWIQQHALRQDAEEETQARARRQPAEAEASAPLTPDAAADQMAPRRFRDFTETLVRGVAENLDAIDTRLVRYTENWPLHRMGGVDRNVLRLAIFEMFFDDQTPPVVIINEAVDLAKYFSSSESGRFVNGILDRACKDVTRPPRAPGRPRIAQRQTPPGRIRPAPGVAGKV
jgi:transcription antitermination protein NusB